MIEVQPLTETALAREALKRMSDGKSILCRAVEVLELVAHSSVGLGEVLQDYAHQACGQLRALLLAAENVSHDVCGQEDAAALANVHFTLKAVKAVLEMTPAAMQRNKAEALGEKEKLSRSAIGEMTHAFLHCPDIARLLATEDSGQVFAGLAAITGANAHGLSVHSDRAFAATRH